LAEAIRLLGTSSKNVISANTIKGSDGTYKYTYGISVAATCNNNFLVGNVINFSEVTNPYSILDTSTQLIAQTTADGMSVSANVITVNSKGGRLSLQGNNATYPIVFLDGAGNAISKINNSGVYSTGAP
jgi:hypothetical protein